MKTTVIFIINVMVMLFTISCNNKQDNSVPLDNRTFDDRDYYLGEALTKGDTSAYFQFSTMDYPKYDLLYPALTMANKYQYHLAYYDVYDALTSPSYSFKSNSGIKNLDNESRTMALDYLKRGAEKGNKECKRILGNLYLEGKYIEKDTIKGKQLIEEGEH